MKNTFGALVLIFLFIPQVQGQFDWLNNLQPNIVVGDSSFTYSVGESMEKYHVNSFSLALIKSTSNVELTAFEKQEALKEIPTNTRYQAGSISKPVAALGVMVLVEKFNLDLDASINQYLKSWEIKSEEYDESQVTIRNLLSHTAGLSVHGFRGYKKRKKVPEVVEILNGKGNSDRVELINAPDSKWKYSGGGYEVLHLLIEDVSGEDFADFIQREVLDAIGMTNSTYSLLFDETCADCAHAYNEEREAYKPNWYLYPESAAAGLWTTPEDLAKFLIYMGKLYNGEDGIVNTSAIKEMFRPILDGYGFGFFVSERNGETYVGHGGKNIGFSNDMLINLDSGEGFVCMTDSDGAFPFMEEIKRSIPGSGVWSERPQVVIVPVEVPIKELETYTGMYDFPGNGKKFKMKLTIQEDKLLITYLQSKTTHTLIPIGKDAFIAKENGVSIVMIEEEEGTVLLWNDVLKLKRK